MVRTQRLIKVLIVLNDMRELDRVLCEVNKPMQLILMNAEGRKMTNREQIAWALGSSEYEDREIADILSDMVATSTTNYA